MSTPQFGRKLLPVTYSLTIVVLFLLSVGCTSQASRPSGILVPASLYPTLQAKYDLEMTNRRDELQFSIALSKGSYTPEENIEFSVTLTNRSRTNVIARKPDASTNLITTSPDLGEIIFMITPHDPTISLNFPALAMPYPGSLVTSPDDFVLLHPAESYVTSITMPRPRGSMPQGQYSVYLKYKNYDFGADSPDREFFVDYNAWMGEIDSNTVTLQIVSQ